MVGTSSTFGNNTGGNNSSTSGPDVDVEVDPSSNVRDNLKPSADKVSER